MAESDSGGPVRSDTSGKVTLTKSAPKVSLDKPRSGGELTVNLNWNARGAEGAAGGTGKRGLMAKLQTALQPKQGIDLDLGCLWEFTDGSKGAVQAVGNSFEARDSSGRPVLQLDGDDRSGAAAGGENLRIDLGRIDSLKRVLVFAMIYEGVPNWEAARAVVTLDAPAQAPIEVLLDEADPNARICGVALIENTAQGLSVRREVRYVKGSQRVLDQAYGWGLSWAPGRKD
ncbi:tellurium resistance protein [Streptomyces sp. RKND-216]|uniref:tellurium resistance protein n=1 Tax=Streptomyces sp. RKND-216 TaxID=2562581 RepID=UPI00109E1D16|nr:tellurium resistance protein [Streptomyces sp. RKND-216]THA26729.1 tellurium resistance protein [Streptomyces sp. RKND-216]